MIFVIGFSCLSRGPDDQGLSCGPCVIIVRERPAGGGSKRLQIRRDREEEHRRGMRGPHIGGASGRWHGQNSEARARRARFVRACACAVLRLVLEVEVQAGNQHAAPGLWTLLDRLGPQCAPWLLRGDRDWGNEGVISETERRGQAYLFKLRLTRRVKQVLERAMRDDDWRDAGAGWQGKHGEIRLMGWSRQRRVILLRRRLAGVMITQREADGQLALGFVEIDKERQEAWEYAVLVTSLKAEVLTIGQLYRDRGDCKNSFDELKNHWGWGGFTTHDLTRCRIMARIVALIFNWWNLFVRLADPAITARRSPVARCCCKRLVDRPTMPDAPL
jgi:hypothetical protein